MDIFSRRDFCFSALAAALAPVDGYALVERTDHDRIMRAAAQYVGLPIRTLTSFVTGRSPGGPHDYFSQADYFWPDPLDPNGKYINRDGQSNPDNFNDHRKAMIALSIQMPALTAAWMLTHDKRYGQHAADHLRAWFITPATRMNTNLEFSQGVHGVSLGRSYGIIDTLHLVEVARAAALIAPAFFTAQEQDALHGWFHEYLTWMKTSDKGIAERDTLNNHAVCWALQAAEFARLIADETTRNEIREQYKKAFVATQMAPNGSFPKELERTKPYSYSIFNFDTLTMLCQSLKTKENDLFGFTLADGRGICRAAEFLYPYLRDKSSWPYRKDVEHFDSLPVRSPGLLFAGLACGHQEYVDLWARLNPDPTDAEIIRNYPLRQPLLWFRERA